MSGALVAFATRNGSTQAVAEVVAATMRAAGETVELRPAREVRRPLGECHLVVLGAPIYSGRWHGDAHRFLKRHRRELGRVPVAVFAMGPRSATEEGWRRSREQLDRARWQSAGGLRRRPWPSLGASTHHPNGDRNGETFATGTPSARGRRHFPLRDRSRQATSTKPVPPRSK